MAETESKIVTGQIAPIKAKDLLPGAFAKATAGGVQITVPIAVEGVHQVKLLAVEPTIVVGQESLDYAAGVAARINAKDNRDKVLAALSTVDESMRAAMQHAAQEMFRLAEDVLAQGGSQYHDNAVVIAKRVTAPASLATMPHTPQAGEMIALAYAVLHYSTKG